MRGYDMKRIWIILCIAWGTLLWGQQFPKYLYGVASWYGEEFAGKKTASGALYDPGAYTAAHRTLPFGTLVEVENLENGKKVQVTINDRGPFVDNRILDVSQKAAEDLGFLQKGTAYVKVTVIRLGDETNTTLPSLTDTNTTPSYPTATSTPVVTNVITNQYVVTNYTNIPAPQAIVVPYEDRPVSQPKPNPAFILDEPEEIFVPAVGKKTSANNPRPTTISPAPTNEKPREVTPTEPQIILSDILLPEERVIPLETKPLTNAVSHAPSSSRQETQEQLQVSPAETLQPGEKYVIQVGAFTRQDNAIHLYQKLRSMNLPAFTSEVTVNNIRYIRVRVGYYTSRNEAQKVLNILYAQKLNPILLKAKP